MNPTIAPYYGGKASHAKRILPLLNRIKHSIYVEPFGGMAGLLMQKHPVKVEVYNDMDKALVTLFEVVRDDPQSLADAIALTPYARDEYHSCLKRLRSGKYEGVELARITYTLLNSTFNNTLTAGGFSTHGPKRLAGPAAELHNTSFFNAISKRLKHVIIENRDWRLLMDTWASHRTLFYLDPPYAKDTRNSTGYRNEWTNQQHTEFAVHLAHIGGGVMCVLSGYDTPLYGPLIEAHWQRLEYPSSVMHAGDGRRRSKTESIWISPAAQTDNTTLF